MEDYCRASEEQFNRLDASIAEINKKLSEMDYFHVHIEKVKFNL